MKRTTVIFECSGIGPKMLYSGSLGSKNLSKFSFRVLEFFKISRKSTCKIEICANFTGHTWPFFELFLMPIYSLDFNLGCIEGLKPQGQKRSIVVKSKDCRKFQFCKSIFSKFWIILGLETKILIHFPTPRNPNFTFLDRP